MQAAPCQQQNQTATPHFTPRIRGAVFATVAVVIALCSFSRLILLWSRDLADQPLLLAGLAVATALFWWRAAAWADGHLPRLLQKLPNHTDLWWITTLTATALLLRVGWVLVADTKPESDFEEYLNLAKHLYATGTFGLDGPSAYRPVAFPFLLSLLLRLHLDPVLFGGLLNALFGALTVVPVYYWTKLNISIDFAGETPDRNAQHGAALAAALWALWPSQILTCANLANEPLFILLLVTILLGFSHLVSRAPSLQLAVAVGVLVGVASYVRPQAMALPLVLASWQLLSQGFQFRRLALVLLTYAVSFLVLLPWGLRNHQQLHKFTVATTCGGITMLWGNNDRANGEYIPDNWVTPPPQELDEISRDAMAYATAKAWILAHPLQFLALIPRKWMALLAPDSEEATYALNAEKWASLQAPITTLCRGYWLAVVCTLAFAARRQRGRPLHLSQPLTAAVDPALAAIALWLIMHAFFHGQSRYHAPLIPVLCLFLALCWRVKAEKV